MASDLFPEIYTARTPREELENVQKSSIEATLAPIIQSGMYQPQAQTTQAPQLSPQDQQMVNSISNILY